MPHLRVFDIQYYVIINTIEKEIYANLFDQFYSSFWFDRQWFFAYHIDERGPNCDVLFYSTDPYRYERI